MEIALQRLIKIIDEIAADIELGDEIIWTNLPHEIRWSWTNTRTNKIWYARLAEVKRLNGTWHPSKNNTSPIPFIVIDFIRNTISAIEARDLIIKLNKLKAFW